MLISDCCKTEHARHHPGTTACSISMTILIHTQVQGTVPAHPNRYIMRVKADTPVNVVKVITSFAIR